MENQTSLEIALDIAIKAARAAGAIQLAHYGSQDLQIHTKSSGIDLVTKVDLECDRVIGEILQSACPDDFRLTEETFDENAPATSLARTWVVDPLDGTTNFAHSFPHFAVSIAYLVQGIPQVGVVYDVLKQELFYATKGQGAFLQKGEPQSPEGQPRKIGVSACQQLSKALLATGFPYNLASSERNNLDFLGRMLPSCHGIRRPGAAALDLAYVACGRLDGFWEITLSPWDVAAGALLLDEAGGMHTHLNGHPLDYSHRRIDIIAANNRTMLQAMASTLNAGQTCAPR